jgi:hypothetical protein
LERKERMKLMKEKEEMIQKLEEDETRALEEFHKTMTWESKQVKNLQDSINDRSSSFKRSGH